ncbi:hypothetical protein [Candidatus Burkholderia verschuerenii]|uniref:hypothetical protein n=1 Tax=Candidatus Burkholderia verschuerenii TaxID=242163 RepID=UPI000B1E39EF|nr:hypothetical protein [Candidatus Burkholderia verschuerenii]
MDLADETHHLQQVDAHIAVLDKRIRRQAIELKRFSEASEETLLGLKRLVVLKEYRHAQIEDRNMTIRRIELMSRDARVSLASSLLRRIHKPSGGG